MFDPHTSILDPEYGEELDGERLDHYINGLMSGFEKSPEAEAFMAAFNTSLGWPATYMDYAAQYFCATPATITPSETAEILFDIFPRKVSVEPDCAQEIIAELRAFWQFLKRTGSLEKADAHLEMLTEEDAARLESYLADPGNFGMAKSIVMTGMNAGFDMTDQEDMSRFMLSYNMKQLGASASNDEEEHSTPPVQQAATIHHESPRIGRNDPCPCGSGRKYKKCCLQ